MVNHSTLITTSRLVDLLSDKDVVLLDIRFYLDNKDKGRQEYMMSHIPGAIFLDIEQDLSSPVIKGITGRHPLPDPLLLESRLRGSGVNMNSRVVVYDQSHSAYASRAWWLLRWLGHDDVFVLDGGFEAWRSEGGDVDNQWMLAQTGNFKATIREEMVVQKEQLLDPSQPIIDSREYRRYTGEFEPIDPVAGHIPGAVCMPYTDNTEASGKWKSKSFLQEKFSSIPDEPIPVFYCGSGVTACHNILAYKIATGKDAKLYAGSWSEWINYYSPA